MTELRRSTGEWDAASVAIEQKIDQLLEKGAPYQEFQQLAATNSALNPNMISKERWGFAIANASSDLRDELANLSRYPVLLFAGGRDGQVDARETVQVFHQYLGEDGLRVHFFDQAGHGMMPATSRRPMNDWDGIVLLLRASILGDAAFVDGFWAALTGFIAAQFD